MDFTARMVALLGRMRRERNGAVADSMRFYGDAYGLNYGVSLPTLRQIAREESVDPDFARFLYQQQVRELRLAALYVADPARVVEEREFWAAGIVNTEVAAEAAFALLSRVPALAELYADWVVSPRPMLVYAALMAAARAPYNAAIGCKAAVDAVARIAAESPATAHWVAQGAVAQLAAYGAQTPELRSEVLREVAAMPASAAAETLREELAWRLEA